MPDYTRQKKYRHARREELLALRMYVQRLEQENKLLRQELYTANNEIESLRYRMNARAR